MHASAAHSVLSYEGNWLRNRLLNDRGRYLTAVLILDLHFNESHGRGITGARLRREVTAYDVCSRGRATAFLEALQFGGYLEVRPTANRRERRLAPTALFTDSHIIRWNGMFAAMAHMDPERAARAAALPASLLFGPCAAYFAETIRKGVRAFDLAPILFDYAERDAGLVTLFSLLSHPEADDPLSISQMARRFSISRAHAMGLMRRAQQDGFAVPITGGYRAGPALQTAMARFFAVVFLIFFRALEACEEARPSQLG
ncbi:MAG: hypothetical protein AB1592_07320 [Pseudomonadota bacterium]